MVAGARFGHEKNEPPEDDRKLKLLNRGKALVATWAQA